MFLIEKKGWYYRPEAKGYTGLKSEAGLYSSEEAAARGRPNGPDGPRDGIVIWREEEAPEFSSQCPFDLKLRHEADKANARAEAAEAQLAEVKAERDRLREALSDMLLAFEEHVALPDANCACHISPPCGDCVNYSFAREAETAARAALKDAQEGRGDA